MLNQRSLLVPLALLGCALAALSGCGVLTARVRGIAPLNPNDYGESTPVDVRFYQLRRAERFRCASVEQLWTAPEPALATDRIADPVIATVYPGLASDEPIAVGLGRRQGDAEFIGVLALFRRGDARDARALVVRVDELADAVLDLSGCSVALVRHQAPLVAANATGPQEVR